MKNHIGKRVFASGYSCSKILSIDGSKLYLRLGLQEGCRDECCTRPVANMRRAMQRQPDRMCWVETDKVFTVDLFGLDISDMPESTMARLLGELLGEDVDIFEP